MTLKPKPPAEVTLVATQVRALLENQHPDLADMPSARAMLRREARDPLEPVDGHTWVRARGWALALGLAHLANSHHDPKLEALGRATIATVLAELDQCG